MCLEILPLAVELLEQVVDSVEIGAQAGIEMPQVALAYLRFQLVENTVQQVMGLLLIH